MSRIDFLILAILEDNNARSRTSSMSLREIADTEAFGCKENTIFKSLKKSEKKGYVATGLKDGHANTYFITKLGAAYLQKEKE